MKKLMGGCLLLFGLLLGAQTAYRRFFQNDLLIEWYWWAGAGACVLVGVLMLAQRD